ncbi:DMT family transporter [Serpentinicella alkaliphila]|uniref:DME family drug/metabolite transporter n=1 Tax=Serpentinicella alkaliphila TaxID=1734049 RepID=A0A4R2TJB3_9FIRM|nr:EamA family transporter [Serpentinicella alkaliphila]QUH25579.1 EamA family transporter [Serpentinicella alkaliphila]TCP97368.1 DME family drug/metabolite transporter [Serpentinicella alkaliphila]
MDVSSNIKESIDSNIKLNIQVNMSLLLIVVASIFWGTSGIAAKHLITTYDIPPLTIGAMRLLIATPILMFTSRVQMQEKISFGKKHLIFFVIYGVSIAMFQITFFNALRISMVSIATLIALCTSPVFVAILSKFFLAEDITRRVAISLSFSTIGTILIMGTSSYNGGAGESQMFGYMLALGAGFSYALITICGKKLVQFYTPVSVVATAFSLASIVMIPFIRIPNNLSVSGWLILLYLGLGPTALAYILFNTGLKKASATKASIASLCEPLTATTLSLAVIGERFTTLQGTGASLLVMALLLIVIKKEQGNPEVS